MSSGKITNITTNTLIDRALRGLQHDAAKGRATGFRQSALGDGKLLALRAGTCAIHVTNSKIICRPNAGFGYASMYVHQRSGLNLTMFRAYSPTLGRWLTRDPLGEGVSPNLYGYGGTNNNPINFVDPLGLDAGYSSQGYNPGTEALAQNIGNGINWITSRHDAQSITMGFYGAMAGIGFGLALGPVGAAAGGSACSRPLTSVNVSQAGLNQVQQHLAQFGADAGNSAMVGRLQLALTNGSSVSGADMNFYLHELAESTMMNQGLTYDAAHAAALSKYGVSPYSLYAPEVIQANPELFGQGFKTFWGIK